MARRRIPEAAPAARQSADTLKAPCRDEVVATGLWVTVPRALVLNYTTPTAIEDVLLVASRRGAPGCKTVADANRAGHAVIEGQAQLALLPTLSAQPLASAQAAMGIRKGDADFLNTWLSLQRQQGWLEERLVHWSLTPAPR